MASKKYILILAMALLVQTVAMAQTQSTDWGWDWSDTSKISVSHMPQHNEFLNNQYIYPAKPRNMWELGLGVGIAKIQGDVNGKYGLGTTISFRKAISNSWSIRPSLTALWPTGAPNAYGVAIGQTAYKNRTFQLGVDAIYSLNAASNYRGNPKTNLYLIGGYSLNAALVQYKGVPGAQPGGYNYFYGLGWPNSQQGTITTFGGATINNRHAYTLFHGLNAGLGFAIKASKRVNVALEHKFTFTMYGYDFLDAWKAGNSNDFYGFTSFRVNINLGNSAKRVEPLWWINPNNYVYSELNVPRHMKLPKVVLPDADGDGVTDQFDMEPNTPKGAPVDSHGVAKDTDGDGVPDFKDKEILTSLKCFPVNADGVGTCPEPACCKELRDMLANRPVDQPVCNIGSLPSVQFSKNSAKLTKAAESVLASAAATIKGNPNCNVKVIGYGASSKAAQQMSWERVNAVIKYLTEKQGISESRLLFQYGQDGDANTVDLQGTTETGPNTVPAPHPNLRKG
jgi:hypothetical protein